MRKRLLEGRIGKTAYALLYCSVLPVAFVFCLTRVEALGQWTDMMGMTFATAPFQQGFEGACILTTGLVVGWSASDLWRALCRIWRGQ